MARKGNLEVKNQVSSTVVFAVTKRCFKGVSTVKRGVSTVHLVANIGVFMVRKKGFFNGA